MFSYLLQLVSYVLHMIYSQYWHLCSNNGKQCRPIKRVTETLSDSKVRYTRHAGMFAYSYMLLESL